MDAIRSRRADANKQTENDRREAIHKQTHGY
jgi:hypothetical protein